MDVFVIIAVSQSIVLGYLLLTKKNARLSDRILSVYFALSALTLLLAYFEMVNRKNGYPYPVLINLSTPFILLHGPALWFYIMSLTAKKFRFRLLYILHFLPFILVVFILWQRNYVLSAQQRIAFETTNSLFHTWTFSLVVSLIALSTQGYYIWGLIILKNYRRNIKTFFSKIDNINLDWLHFLLIASIFFHAIISGLYALNISLEFASYGNLQLIGFLIASVFVLVIGIFGLKQGDIFSSIPEKFNFEKAADNTGSIPKLTDKEEVFVHQLLVFMKERKPFLNPELTLSSLSNDLNTTPDFLSGILNNRLNKNFFDFVNHYRIEEFKTRCNLPENKKITLLGLAYDCGFSSKATFNRVFKNVVGITPSEYLQEVSKK